MRHISAAGHIPAPPDELFAFLAEPANLPRWQTGIVAADRTSAGPVGVGSTAHVVRELLGQRLAVDLTITAFEPGHRLVLQSGSSGIGVEAVLGLEPDDGGTQLTFGMTIRAQSLLMAPVEGMVAGAAERDLADSLERLRHHFGAEGDAAT